MQRTTLGHTGIEVSAICLGTMTWGRQTGEEEAHAQIERAMERGVDFWDTAEMYPVNPVLAESVGGTETIIGNWFAKSGRRDKVVLATKCTSLNNSFVRQGQPVTPDNMAEALEGSLRRLQTDYIDLYQLHWPVRGSYHFRQHWRWDPSKQDTAEARDGIAALVEAVEGFVKAGKIRAFGLSNESTWGTMQWLAATEGRPEARVATMQNEFSMLCRLYDTDMAEMTHHEGLTALPWSPLAAGLLTGKYQDGSVPEGSRAVNAPDLGGRKTERAIRATEAYLGIARKHGIDPVSMAVAWTRHRPFHSVPIIGATRLDQLDVNIDGGEITLSEEVLREIDDTHMAHPMPY